MATLLYTVFVLASVFLAFCLFSSQTFISAVYMFCPDCVKLYVCKRGAH